MLSRGAQQQQEEAHVPKKARGCAGRIRGSSTWVGAAPCVGIWALAWTSMSPTIERILPFNLVVNLEKCKHRYQVDYLNPDKKLPPYKKLTN
jgi:hypothetical protein